MRSFVIECIKPDTLTGTEQATH